MVIKKGYQITEEDKVLIRYSMELSMLGTLLQKNLITKKEYEKIKARIMLDYNIVSHFVV